MARVGPDGIETSLALEPGGVVSGFARDTARPERRLVVEVLADGLPVALLRAELFRPDVEAGDGCCGFAVRLAPDLLARTGALSARLANAEDGFGRLSGPFGDLLAAPPPRAGEVRWAGGLTLRGWRDGDPSAPPAAVRALVEGREVARASATGWDEASEAGVRRLVRAFALHLPDHLADGRAHEVDVVTEEGAALDGSPQLVFALAAGFADAVEGLGEVESERARARFADGLLPRSVPFPELAAWRERFPGPTSPDEAEGRVTVMVVGEDGLDTTLASLDRQRGCTWEAAALESHGSPAGFKPGALRAFREQACAGSELVVACVAGTRFAPDALWRLLDGARRFPEATAVYADLAAGPSGEGPIGAPAFDAELFLERGYCGLCFALRPAALDAAAADCDSLFALFPFGAGGADGNGRSAPAHVPHVLAELPRLDAAALAPALADASRARLARAGVEAAVSPDGAGEVASCRVGRVAPPGAASVIVSSSDDGSCLEATLDGLRGTAGRRSLEVVVADGGSGDPDTLRALAAEERRGTRVLRLGAWSSPARRLDEAARAARGDLLLFVRPGLVPEGPGWLEELLSRAAAPRCGAVGALVASARGLVRHAGYVLGPRFAAVPRFLDCHVGEPGYAGLLEAAHEVSAASAACLLTPRRDFEAVGGFDARRFPTAWFDVDYCLKLRRAGRRVLFAPRARMRALDGSRALAGWPPDEPGAQRQAAALAARWALVPGCDPFYPPWMAMDERPFSGLAWPPAQLAARQPSRPAPRPGAPGISGEVG